eukprot:scaffold72055_cov22-Tisochrysis_lutea.AAC.1
MCVCPQVKRGAAKVAAAPDPEAGLPGPSKFALEAALRTLELMLSRGPRHVLEWLLQSAFGSVDFRKGKGSVPVMPKCLCGEEIPTDGQPGHSGSLAGGADVCKLFMWASWAKQQCCRCVCVQMFEGGQQGHNDTVAAGAVSSEGTMTLLPLVHLLGHHSSRVQMRAAQ